jgi:hypothetical protein
LRAKIGGGDSMFGDLVVYGTLAKVAGKVVAGKLNYPIRRAKLIRISDQNSYGCERCGRVKDVIKIFVVFASCKFDFTVCLDCLTEHERDFLGDFLKTV